ncbi:DoxX family membrane protein [bacterium]|nr:DoxX family membrane protein [bacterium]
MTHHNRNAISNISMILLTILRVGLGWHCLYEGLAKLFEPGWTSANYLMGSRWIFSGFFNWLASSPGLLRVIDFLNVWGLIFIGLGLFLGAFTRVASIAGAFLLLLYYLAYPPFVGMELGVPAEGNYIIVNKTLIEVFTLGVLAFIPTGHYFGLDRIIWRLWKKITKKSKKEESDSGALLNRREILKGLAPIPFLAPFIWATASKKAFESYEEKNLADAYTSATVKTFNFTSLNELKVQVPHTQIGGVDFSKLILGGNLIGGWAHARDLVYVSSLVKRYHSLEKISETFQLAERCGINAFLTNNALSSIMMSYWKRNMGKIKFISDCGSGDLFEAIQQSIDNGAAACYVQGQRADNLVETGDFDSIAKALDMIRQNGLPAGIGGHYLKTVQECIKQGLEPDFWMKTFHHLNYWSATAPTERDNVFCREPEETIAFMKDLKQPFIAFKVLAAGAIRPADGFRWALENGADMLCVGMYDFQIVDDVNTFCETINSPDLKRERPWIV